MAGSPGKGHLAGASAGLQGRTTAPDSRPEKAAAVRAAGFYQECSSKYKKYRKYIYIENDTAAIQ
jgi:hypothetical protein